MDAMRELLGPGWAYYVAFGILFLWWVLVRVNK
jgi:hypothetical protein